MAFIMLSDNFPRLLNPNNETVFVYPKLISIQDYNDADKVALFQKYAYNQPTGPTPPPSVETQNLQIQEATDGE